MTRPLLTARGLTRAYGTAETTVLAVDEVDLDIHEREFVVITGPSGSGKSTLLYLLSGLERPTAGEVLFDGQRIDNLGPSAQARLRRRGMGFVFQAVHLVPNLSLLENILVPGCLIERDHRKVERRAQSLLDGFGIGHLGHRLPAQVSGGEAQRAAIARALINRPAVLFADEPTGALDSTASERVLDVLQAVHAEGQAVVMVTHDMQAALRGSRQVSMLDGRLAVAGGEACSAAK